eukprot:UN28113
MGEDEEEDSLSYDSGVDESDSGAEMKRKLEPTLWNSKGVPNVKFDKGKILSDVPNGKPYSIQKITLEDGSTDYVFDFEADAAERDNPIDYDDIGQSLQTDKLNPFEKIDWNKYTRFLSSI